MRTLGISLILIPVLCFMAAVGLACLQYRVSMDVVPLMDTLGKVAFLEFVTAPIGAVILWVNSKL